MRSITIWPEEPWHKTKTIRNATNEFERSIDNSEEINSSKALFKDDTEE